MKTSKKLWSVDFALVLITGHFMFVSYYALFTLVPPLAVERGGEEWEIGIVIGSIGVMALIVRPFGGRWVNSFGAKRVAIAGATLFAITNLLYLLASNIWILIPIRMLQGMGVAIGPVATSTMVANLAPESRRGEAMGFMGIAIALSGLYSPVLAFWLLSELGFHTGFIYAAAGGLLGCLSAAKISSSNTKATSINDKKEALPLIPQRAIFPTVVFIGYTVTTAPVNTFLPLLSSERDLGNPGLYFTAFSIATILLMSFSGPLADRFGRASVVIPGMIASSISMFMLSGSHNQTMFLGSGLLNGIGFGLIQPGIQALVVDRVRPKERGPAMATVQQGWDIGGSGAFFLGPIGSIAGIASTFTISGMITLLATAGFIYGNNRKQS